MFIAVIKGKDFHERLLLLSFCVFIGQKMLGIILRLILQPLMMFGGVFFSMRQRCNRCYKRDLQQLTIRDVVIGVIYLQVIYWKFPVMSVYYAT